MKQRRGEMTKLGSLFTIYEKRLKAPQASVVKIVCEVVHEITGHPLKPQQVSYTVATKTIAFSLSSLERQEIRLSYEEILQALKERLGSSAPDRLL
jgi:hypothetical protein